MSKKKTYKRPNVPQAALERARAELRNEATEVVTPVVTTTTTATNSAGSKLKVRKATPLATRRIPTAEELQAEYAYVLRDLRNLAMLAVVLVGGIFAAAILLPR